ncbi:MAG: acyltransferase family protein [Clostridiales bacterium]|nr:acyltransferase family protein [Clostridiales bacterium]
MDKRISSNIKIFSFVVSCFMVLFHAGMYDNSNAINQFDRELSELINYDYKLLAFFGLSFFFSVTGFLLFYGLNYRNYLKKIERRVHSLLIPYLIWQALVLIKDLCIGRRYEILDVLLRTFGLELWPLNGPLWYVYVVFLLALLLSPVLLLMFSSKRSAWISTFAMLILIRFLKQTSIEPVRIVVSYGLFSRILTYLPAYMIGAYYGRFYEKNRMPESMVYSLAVVLFAYLLDFKISGFFTDMVVMTLPMVLIFIFPSIPKLENRKIYGYTFLIYALHHPFIVDLKGFIDEGLAWIPIPVTILNIFEHMLILAASVLLAAGLSKLLEKLSPKILAVLTGGRTPVNTGDSTSG